MSKTKRHMVNMQQATSKDGQRMNKSCDVPQHTSQLHEKQAMETCSTVEYHHLYSSQGMRHTIKHKPTKGAAMPVATCDNIEWENARVQTCRSYLLTSRCRLTSDQETQTKLSERCDCPRVLLATGGTFQWTHSCTPTGTAHGVDA